MSASDRPLRILHVASHAKVARGGAVQMIRLAREQHRRGHHVQCVVHHTRLHRRPLEWDFSEIVEAGLPMISFDQSRWSEVLRFRRWLRENPFDILHAHRDRALGFSHCATWRMARPVILANRGTTNTIPRRTFARRAFLSRRLGAVVAVAEAIRRALVEQDGVDEAKIHVVYGSVETDRFHPGVDGAAVRCELGVDKSTPLVGLPAALAPKKGHSHFVEMMPRVLREMPEVHFLWVGEGRRARFGEITEGLAEPRRLHWLEHRDDMAEVLAACSVVLCCSTKGEGLTGALREALAMARPVITTDVSGNTEMVRDGETGRVVPIGDPEAMARAVLETLRHPVEAQRLAEAGRQWVLRECTDAVRADRIESICRSLLS
ncbi:glycosyltransferase family 4 protein [Candidatus Sumerlaeota bacterium]|nr:glycosyltransferase family 4 protein [Candidatus Sumerlaeota bacterium]